MKKILIASCVLATLTSTSALALTVKVEAFRDGNIPYGYQNVGTAGTPDIEQNINLDDAQWLDWLVPENSGSAGITATKDGADWIGANTVDAMGGSNALSDPDIYQVVFDWTTGAPTASAFDYFGVTWTGWSADDVATLNVRVNLQSDEPVKIYHWFNDGWNYGADGSGHSALDGHVFEVTHYDASDNVIDSFTTTLASGGAEAIFGDHRQFYTASINVKRQGTGDYVLITNNGGNIGYKGTAITESSLEVVVQSFRNGMIPAGYQDVSDGIEISQNIDLDAAMWVDWLVPENSGSAGITATKTDSNWITATTVDTMGGSNNLIDPDIYQVVFD